MGFSVSGSLVVVLLGLFVALGAFYGSFSNTVERVTAAERDQLDRLDRVQHTDVAVDSVSLLSGVDCGLEVSVTNTGESKLDLNRTDLLYDNEYRTGWRSGATVEGDGSTDVWLPGETVTITTDGLPVAPERIKVVSGPGVADVREVFHRG